jgi:predicted lipid carrier protein YhbT
MPLRLIPDVVHAEFLARAFNHFIRGQPMAGRLAEINGKSVCLHIKDATITTWLRIENGKLRAAIPGKSDARISGNAEDFWQLAARREDPDTLFFSRRLSMEGDTETGLHIKNLLDALEYDWESHFREVLGQSLGAVAASLLECALGHFLAGRGGIRPQARFTRSIPGAPYQ